MYGFFTKSRQLGVQYNVCLADNPLLRMLAIADKSKIPGGNYGGLTENDSHYYRLSVSRNYRHLVAPVVTIL